MCREKRQVRSSALSAPLFRRYYPASWFSSLGGWMLRFLLGWSAWALTESSFWVGIVGALMLAPAILLSPYFGVQSDRVNPRHGLIISMAVHAVIGLTGAVTTATDLFGLNTLLLLATTMGAVTALHSPMRLALVPLLVSREALPSAVGLTAMSFNIARILGPAISAVLLASVGLVWAWSLPVAMFFISALLLAVIRGVGTREIKVKSSVNAAFLEAGRYALAHSQITFILMITATNGLLGRSFIELLPAISGRVLNGDATELAWLTAAAGAGAVAGGLVLTQQQARVSSLFRLLLGAMVIAVLLLASLKWMNTLTSLMILVAILSSVTTITGTSCQTLTQLIVTEQYRGRVLSLWSMTAMGAPALGAAWQGWMAESVGFVDVYLTAALAGVLATLFFYLRGRPAFT